MARKSSFLETVLRNPKIVFLLVGLLVVFGIYGLDKMNKQEFPEFTIRQGIVAAVYPGATPLEVESQVTKPLEEYLFTYQEVNKKLTYSYTKEGIVYIYVELDNSVTNQNQVWSRIRHGLKDFKSQLPPGVAALVVIDDFGNTSSLLITMDAEDKSYRELERYMDRLKDRLRTVPAVGNIKSFGEQHEEIAVTIDRVKLATYGISMQSLTATLFAQGFVSVGASLNDECSVVPIHITSPFASEVEIGEQVIYTFPSGETLRLKDVARVERRYEAPSSFITKDGRRALVLSIEMQQGNNIVKFGKAVDDVMQDFLRTMPDGVNLYRITDLPQVVDDSIWSFMRDLITAILVVILVMLLLFPLSSALIPAIEIPLTTAITISIMYLVGYELNTVTLAALIVTLGMIVDDSIVMIDGYMDNVKRGQKPWDASLSSARFFFPSLAVATVAICGIFFPYLFTMHGPLADFVKFFPTTITISLCVSLALAMLLTPYLEQRMIKPETHRTRKDGAFARMQRRFFERLQGGYERLLDVCFRHPWLTIGAGVASVGVAVLLFLHLPLQLMPKAERDSFAVEVYLPEGSDLSQTERVCKQFEEVLRRDEQVESVTTFVGSSSPRFMAAYNPKMPGRNYGQMIVKTVSYAATEEVVARYKDAYVDSYPGATVRVKQLDYQAVNNPVEVRLQGEDVVALQRCADSLMTTLRSYDELVWIHSDWDAARPTVRVTLREAEASRYGITRATLSAQLATLYGGVPMTTVWEGDYAVAVRLFSESGTSDDRLGDISNMMIPTVVPGVWVPLRQVADVSPAWEPATVAHRNGVPCVTVGADLAFGVSQPLAMRKLRPWLEERFRPSLPDDVVMTYGGLDAVNDGTLGDIVVGLIASVMIVFFFLLFNFKKIRLTLLALCGTMLCLLGAFVGLAVFGCDVSLTAIIGIVSLIGINVRNTIVMFDYAEELRDQGQPLRDVAYEAGRRRMRPIFLTSATTAVGVIPMIVHRSALWMPMGVVICFGTICAIVFIVTVMPVAYWKLFARAEARAKGGRLKKQTTE
ncbi:MAG: efflux RND transporter permease subunit [Bacteroidales bacterium]|nr:efflux RND transporter permease subunit [Bacteroidales bacterium]